ncbi:MAG TPA: VCBS repeat-containing protein [Solirubrobacterales bacterium]|nr:VCBS repeat-containing protein [Solirubrobacterales bacterium]
MGHAGGKQLLGSIATTVALALAFPALARGGDGTFEGLEPVFDAGSDPAGIATGDLDRDGDRDLVIGDGDPAATEVTVAVNNGDGTSFTTTSVTIIDATQPAYVSLAHLDRDGDLDLITANRGSDNVTIAMGGPGATFPGATQGSLGVSDGPSAVETGDFDADGDEDLVILCASASDTLISVNDGTGIFESPTENVESAASPVGVAISDFDGNGDEDLAIADAANSQVVIAPGGIGVSFPDAGVTNVPVEANPRAVEVADFDLNGDEDLVVPNLGGGSVSVLPGAAGTTFGAAQNTDTIAPPTDVALGDFNSDGDADFATANPSDASGGYSFFEGQNGGGFELRNEVNSGGGSAAVAVADFDGDGNQDLATSLASRDEVAIKLGKGKPPLKGNLLDNGGFEGDNPANSFPDVPPVPKWKRTGGNFMTYALYGYATGIYAPTPAQSALFSGEESHLYGGFGDTTAVTQTVKVPKSKRKKVSKGKVDARFSAYLGGGAGFEDSMSARLEFLDKSGDFLIDSTLGPVTAADRGSVTTMLRQEGTSLVPNKTRKMRVVMTASDNNDDYNGAVADNVKLTLKKLP